MYFMQKPRFKIKYILFPFYTDINKTETPTLIVWICCKKPFILIEKTSLYFRYSKLMKNG